MIPASACALSRICARYCWRRSSASPSCIASRVRPSKPLSGVRISWLVLARKALFARLAASAASRAAARASSSRRRSVTSSAIQIVPPLRGSLRSTTCASSRHQKLLPSLRRTRRSISNGRPADSTGSASSPTSRWSSSLGQITEPGWLARLPGSQPNMRSKNGLASTKRPARVNAMPIEARSRIAECCMRVRSLSVTSRVFSTR